MAATIKGIQPLKFGTSTITGYVVEDFGGDATTQELVIEDEVGDIITQIFNFGNKNEVTVSVIPKSATAVPVLGDLFSYPGFAMNILAIARKHVRKDVEKWVMKGTIYPGVTPS